jgi:hypothetical protein
MNYVIVPDSTSQLIEFPVYDSSSATGALLASLTFETANLVAYYSRWGVAGSAVAMTLATMTKGTWATRGFVAVDGTNQIGRYQFGIPDAAIAAATGVTGVTITIQGATNMVPVTLNIQFLDLATADDIVAAIDTAKPDVTVDTSGIAGQIVAMLD